jgi:hypothetical protein
LSLSFFICCLFGVQVVYSWCNAEAAARSLLFLFSLSLSFLPALAARHRPASLLLSLLDSSGCRETKREVAYLTTKGGL